MSLRRKRSAEDQAALEEHGQREQTAHQLRESVTRLRTTFSLQALRDQLPLCFPSAHTRELAFRAQSWYTYPGWAPLAVRTQLEALTPFYVALLLTDFAPLRAELVALTEIHLNAPGQTPFDPVSLFRCHHHRLSLRKRTRCMEDFQSEHLFDYVHLVSPWQAAWLPHIHLHQST